MKTYFTFIMLFFCGISFALPHAWINEFHYDNSGSDRNEFVEVVVENPEGHYLGDLVLYMYNGYDGRPYCLDSIDEFTLASREGPFQFYVWYHSGIQNDTEGMVLVFRDTILDILAYEGEFTGMTAPANGVIFPDIGIYENGSGPDTNALFLTGMPGSVWSDGPATPGSLNTGQVLHELGSPVELIDFNAVYRHEKIDLEWETASETENAGFRLYRNGKMIGFIEGAGSSSWVSAYRLEDPDITKGTPYRYVLCDIGFSGQERILDSVNVIAPVQTAITLGSPYPNPANPMFYLPLSVSKSTFASIMLVDIRGKRMTTLFKGALNTGDRGFTFSCRDLPSGKYFIECITDKERSHREILILK